MNPEECLKAGEIGQALAALREKVRSAPTDAPARRFLFQLLCVAGEWEKALTQLQVLSDLEAGGMLSQILGPVIGCELLRAEVFRGKKSPLIFGEPVEWMGWMVQACVFVAQGQLKSARELRERALEAAPAVAGAINGEPFEWIADADSRLGPFVEAVIDGKYFWVPFERIARISVESPSDLRDMVWIPAMFGWSNGGEAWGHIPVRYPGSEASTDGAIRLARKTEWTEAEGGTFLGLGQRMFSTDANDFPLLEVRRVEMQSAAG
jgi:type VI secretion system protein ImpE